MAGMRRAAFFFKSTEEGRTLGEQWQSTPAVRPAETSRSALGKTGRGGLRKSKGTVGLVGESPEKGSATRDTAAGACRTWGRRRLQGVFSMGLWLGSIWGLWGVFRTDQFGRRG